MCQFSLVFCLSISLLKSGRQNLSSRITAILEPTIGSLIRRYSPRNVKCNTVAVMKLPMRRKASFHFIRIISQKNLNLNGLNVSIESVNNQ